MTARILYRISALVFVLFAAGHTAGFLLFRPANPEALKVLEGMRDVHFAFGSASVTYAQLYTGFGLFISAALLMFVWLAWQLGTWSGTNPVAAQAAGRALLVLQVANTAICLYYFSVVQVVFAAVGALLVLMALVVSRRPLPAV